MGRLGFSLILYIFFFLRQGLELTSSVRLASEPQGSSCLRLSVLALQVCVAAAPGFFMWFLEDWTRVLMLL